MTAHIVKPRQSWCDACQRKPGRDKLCIIEAARGTLVLYCERCMMDVYRQDPDASRRGPAGGVAG